MVELIMLKLLFEVGEMKLYIYLVVIKNNDDLILIDIGYFKFLLVIEEVFEKYGLDMINFK